MTKNETNTGSRDGVSIPAEPESLDPHDWAEFRNLAHKALDEVLDGIVHLREGPAWREPTREARHAFEAPFPHAPLPLAEILKSVREDIAPFSTGNRHPRFMGWVHGAGTAHGVIAEMIAAGLNMNCGGRNHIGFDVECQIVRWMAEALEFPETSSGLFLTGSSMANFLAVIIAKTSALGRASRETGLDTPEAQRLVGYTSAEAHGCIRRAFELSGLGAARLRTIAVDSAFRMRPDALETAIRKDLADGRRPFLCIATAGTVNTGAFDPIAEIASLAQQHGLWLHIDGAIGALSAFSPVLKPRLEGIARADSIALDFHKSGHVPYDAGFLLVKDRYKHLLAFSSEAHYLQRSERGAAAGPIWPADLGPDLSRGFRALKAWFTLKAFGADAIGRSIENTVALAKELARKIESSPDFELKAPVEHNIVCFGAKRPGNSALNREIVIELQMSGLAVPSWTEIAGETVIRLAIVNHRTTRDDLDMTLRATAEIARRLRGTCG